MLPNVDEQSNSTHPGTNMSNLPVMRTPGLSTKRSRVTRRVLDLSGIQLQAHNDIINKSWVFHAVGPLYKFKSDRDGLVFLRRELKKNLIKNIRDSVSMTINELKVTVTHCPHLPIFGDAKSEGIHIKVARRPDANNNGRRNRGEAIVYESYLISPEPSYFESIEFSSQEDFTYLPLMMSRGRVKLCKTVQEVVENLYDCAFHKVKFSSYHLNWLSAMWESTGDVSGRINCSLVYKLPPEIRGMEKITYRVEAAAWMSLWRSIRTANSNAILWTEVETLYAALKSHFFASFKIYLDSCNLTKVITPAITADSRTGLLKISLVDYVPVCLEFLTGMVMEQLGITVERTE